MDPRKGDGTIWNYVNWKESVECKIDLSNVRKCIECRNSSESEIQVHITPQWLFNKKLFTIFLFPLSVVFWLVLSFDLVMEDISRAIAGRSRSRRHGHSRSYVMSSVDGHHPGRTATWRRNGGIDLGPLLPVCPISKDLAAPCITLRRPEHPELEDFPKGEASVILRRFSSARDIQERENLQQIRVTRRRNTDFDLNLDLLPHLVGALGKNGIVMIRISTDKASEVPCLITA